MSQSVAKEGLALDTRPLLLTPRNRHLASDVLGGVPSRRGIPFFFF